MFRACIPWVQGSWCQQFLGVGLWVGDRTTQNAHDYVCIYIYTYVHTDAHIICTYVHMITYICDVCVRIYLCINVCA